MTINGVKYLKLAEDNCYEISIGKGAKTINIIYDT